MATKICVWGIPPVSRSTITGSSPTGLRPSDRKHKLPPDFAARTYSEQARGPFERGRILKVDFSEMSLPSGR
jgi:hypothetical protein